MGQCPSCERRAQRVDHARPGHRPQASYGPAARQRWRAAIGRVCKLLRLRRRWARLGQFLQLPQNRTLFLGLERRDGTLVRVADPAVVVQRRVAKAAAREAAKHVPEAR